MSYVITAVLCTTYVANLLLLFLLNLNLNQKVKEIMKIFSKENLKPFLIGLSAVMVGLAVHQVVVAPRLKEHFIDKK